MESCIIRGCVEAAEQKSAESNNDFDQEFEHIQNSIAANKAALENVGQSWTVCSYLLGICVFSALVLFVALFFQCKDGQTNAKRMLRMEAEIAALKQVMTCSSEELATLNKSWMV